MFERNIYKLLGLCALLIHPFSPAQAMSLSELEEKINQLYKKVAKNSQVQGPYFGFDNALDDSGYFTFALKSYCALKESDMGAKITNPRVFTIINMELDTHAKRLSVYDIKNKKMVFQTWTTHGEASTISFDVRLADPRTLTESMVHYRPTSAKFFSNVPTSGQSSVGMAVADSTTYMSTKSYGGIPQGESLRLIGVDGNLNDEMWGRGVVIHQFKFTPWDSNKAIPTSQGCFMIPLEQIATVRNLVKGGAVLIDHERLNQEYNEVDYKDDLENIRQLKATFEQSVANFRKKYPFLTSSQFANWRGQLQENLDVLKTKVEATNNYFKNNPSKFIGKDPQDVDGCAAALGIN